MKFFEQMDVDEREAMILRAAAFNMSLEGMEDSKNRLLEEAKRVQTKKDQAILQKVNSQTNE